MSLRSTLLVALIAVGGAAPLSAQSAEPQRELGATVTWLNLNGLNQTAGGLGGRLGIHIVDLLWLDAEATVFPTDDRLTGRKLQAFAGAKIGSRSRLFGLFGKVRPGGIRFSRDFMPPGRACIAIFPTPAACLADRRALALDYGSVVELYPSDRAIIRIDAATTYIWYGSQGEAPRVRTGNFQFAVGFARRF